MYDSRLIGNKISEARQRKGLSRGELADMCAVTVQAVGKWERGESLPDIIMFKRLAEILDESMDYFFGGLDIGAIESCEAEKDLRTEVKPAWDLSAANWKDADFSGLQNIANKFNFSNVVGCKFRNSDLSGIGFRGNNIKNCDFGESNLSGGRFLLSNIVGNNFEDCNCRGLVVKMCDVHDCGFLRVDFGGAELSGSVLRKCSLGGAKLNAISFKNMTFIDLLFDSDIIDCSFVGCFYKNVEFRGVTLRNSFFKNQKIKKVRFVDCRADKPTRAFLLHAGADISGIVEID